jgi:hypothetical protein
MNYDRSKQYTWNTDDMFEISGTELGMISKFLRAILSTEEAAKIMLAQQSDIAVQSIISRAVEAGKIEEAPKQTPENITQFPKTNDDSFLEK